MRELLASSLAAEAELFKVPKVPRTPAILLQLGNN